MIIIPDLFTPFIKGREAAIAANWNDLNQYNRVQKGQVDNLYAFETFGDRTDMVRNQAQQMRDQTAMSGDKVALSAANTRNTVTNLNDLFSVMTAQNEKGQTLNQENAANRALYTVGQGRAALDTLPERVATEMKGLAYQQRMFDNNGNLKPGAGGAGGRPQVDPQSITTPLTQGTVPVRAAQQPAAQQPAAQQPAARVEGLVPEIIYPGQGGQQPTTATPQQGYTPPANYNVGDIPAPDMRDVSQVNQMLRNIQINPDIQQIADGLEVGGYYDVRNSNGQVIARVYKTMDSNRQVRKVVAPMDGEGNAVQNVPVNVNGQGSTQDVLVELG